MSNRCDCAKHSAVSRAMERQGRKLDREDYEGTLGHRNVSSYIVVRYYSFPRPTSYTPDGSRMWSFPLPA